MADIILVGYDKQSGDIPVLTVGKKDGKTIEIINAFQGNEAKELYEKLTTIQKGEEK